MLWWSYLSLNPSAIHLLEENIDKINWCELSVNPSAIHLLENNINKINWNMLSLNPSTIHLLEKHIDKIDWIYLSFNPSAIHLLENNIDKINILLLANNESLNKLCFWRPRYNMYFEHLRLKIIIIYFMICGFGVGNDPIHELFSKFFNFCNCSFIE